MVFLSGIVLVITIVGCGEDKSPTSPEDVKTWQKTFGGSEWDWGTSVQQTPDGGYIIVGVTNSFGAGLGDVWLIRIDENGDTVWSKTIGGANYDAGYSLGKAGDGYYVITGGTASYGEGNRDVLLIKIDTDGKQVWQKTFGGPEKDYGNWVEQTPDGGYIIVGGTASFGAGDSDAWLIRTDQYGNLMWDKTFGGAGKDYASVIHRSADGGYIILGGTNSYGAGDYDLWLIKTDANGSEVWSKPFGGSSYDDGYSVLETADGGYIIVGVTFSYGAGDGDVWMIKTNPSGEEVWSKTFGGTDYDAGYCCEKTRDGKYVITGVTYSYGEGGGDVWLFKTDANGNKIWETTFGGTGDEWGVSVECTADGGYIVGGATDSYGEGGKDVFLIKTNAIGEID